MSQGRNTVDAGDTREPDCRPADRPLPTRRANVNGINIAYRVQGDGPPLVLVMGYRLSSIAWPETFIETLARQFTVITLDNRGTGLSDKPVAGYAIANMARDIKGLLDESGDSSRSHAGLLDGRHHRAGVRPPIPGPRLEPDPLRDHVRRASCNLCQTIGARG